MSPDLLNLYSQKMIQDLDDLEGVRVGGVNMNNIRHADETVTIADAEEQLQDLASALKRTCCWIEEWKLISDQEKQR